MRYPYKIVVKIYFFGEAQNEKEADKHFLTLLLFSFVFSRLNFPQNYVGKITSKSTLATLAKRKQTKASIMVFSSILKRSEQLRLQANYFRSEANTFDRIKIMFEAK